MNRYLARLQVFSRTATAKLALSYLVIIMLMSLFFSGVIYNTSAHDLGRPPRPDIDRQFILNSGEGFSDFFQERITEARHALLIHLVLINLLVLAGGGILSYYLARRTLEPIETNMESQSQFVSDASHELRTPLTALQTANEVALRKQKISTKEAKDIFGQNIEDVLKLRTLTDNLLNLAKADSGAYHYEAAALPDIVTSAMNNVLDSAAGKHIAIEDKVPKFSVLADTNSLTQAVTTILDNAIKYSPEHSTVHVTAAQQGKYGLLSIKDEGVGIKADHLPYIFDRFYQVDESRSKRKQTSDDGYGIGLSLARKIVERHNGEIIAASRPGKGSTFTLKLPLS